MLAVGLEVGDAVLAGVGAVGAVTKVEVRPLVLLHTYLMFIDQNRIHFYENEIRIRP